MITLVDHSTDGPGAPVLAGIAAALTEQLRHHVAPAWGRRPVPVMAAERDPLPSAATPVVIFDDADQAGALGFHAKTPDGRPYARVFAAPVLAHGGDWTSTALSVSSVISHEVVELFVDPSVNLWSDDGRGNLYALEVADPVEAASYAVSVEGMTVTVSDFVLPAWFDATAGGAVDHLGRLDAPFALDGGGYAVVSGQGEPHQVFGASAPSGWRSTTKHFPASRTWRRLHAWSGVAGQPVSGTSA